MSDSSHNFSEDDLLAYVHGTASEDLATRIEVHKEQDRSLATELALMSGLKPALSQASEGTSPPGELDWKRLETQIRKETSELREAPASDAGQAGGGRIVYWQAAAVFFAVVALGQMAYVNFTSRTVDPVYQTATGISQDQVLVIKFAPNTSLQEASTLLRETAGRIVDGPAASGLYRIAFKDAGALEAGRQRLGKSAIIETIMDQ